MPTIYKPKKREQKSNNMYDDARRKIYNSERWRKLRAWKMVNNPLCEVCWQRDWLHRLRMFIISYHS